MTRDPIRPSRQSRTSRSISLAIVGISLAAISTLAAGCGGRTTSPGVAAVGTTASSSTTISPGSGTTSSNDLSKLEAYATCMRSHGILNFPDPSPNSSGGGSFNFSGSGKGGGLKPNSPQFITANKACQSRLPGGSSTPHQSAQKIAEEVKLAGCMRGHGFPSFPDPNSQGAFVLNQVDPNSPKFQTAIKTCQTAVGFSGPVPVTGGSSGNG